MKRLLLLIAVLLLCSPVMALSLTFQKVGDQNYVTFPAGVAFSENTSGGNSYLHTASSGQLVYNAIPLASTYVAFDRFAASPGDTYCRFYDSGMGLLFTSENLASVGSVGRFEVVISPSGDVTSYKNGNVIGSGTTTTEYPVYFGCIAPIDNIVYGSSENRNIFSMPDYTKYKIIKDVVNPAATGFGWVNGTIIASTSFTSTWGRSNITEPGNESIILREVSTQTVYETKYTNLAAFGLEYWNVSAITLTGAPYGFYEITIPDSGTVSDPILYTSIGATITLDKHVYTTGDTAVATYAIEPAYQGLGTYRVDTMNVYGTIIDSQTLTTMSGTIDIPFSTSDSLGVYYTVLIVDTGGGDDTWLAYDYSELNGYVIFEGYVNGAETEAPIAAHINITQSALSEIFDYDTIVENNYSYSTVNNSFLAGSEIAVNITASGYRQYTYAFTPALAKTVALNFTLVPLSPTYDIGLAIGGVARETTYGRPIPTARVDLTNVTHSEACDTTTNSVGYYLADYGLPCPLTVNRNYQAWGSKTNYANSTIYNVTAEGAI
jgi:hypothetical protein